MYYLSRLTTVLQGLTHLGYRTMVPQQQSAELLAQIDSLLAQTDEVRELAGRVRGSAATATGGGGGGLHGVGREALQGSPLWGIHPYGHRRRIVLPPSGRWMVPQHPHGELERENMVAIVFFCTAGFFGAIATAPLWVDRAIVWVLRTFHVFLFPNAIRLAVSLERDTAEWTFRKDQAEHPKIGTSGPGTAHTGST